MFPLGPLPPQVPPHPSYLQKFTKEAKTQAGDSYIFLGTPQVANSELKCVIQYYTSGQLRKDVNCK